MFKKIVEWWQKQKREREWQKSSEKFNSLLPFDAPPKEEKLDKTTQMIKDGPKKRQH